MSLCVFSTSKRLLLALLVFVGAKTHSQNTDSLWSKKFQVTSVQLEGNKKTRPRIIMRELTFSEGDSLTLPELARRCLRTQQNLMNTSLFVYDTVSYVPDTAASRVTVKIKVQERWYLWPGLIFEIQDRNFNSWWQTRDLFRINYGVSLTVYNLFGLNQTLTMIFRRGYTEQYGASYRIPFINKKQTLGLVASFNYFRNNEIWYRTHDDVLQFHRDYKQYVRRDQEAKLGLVHRHKLYVRQTLELFVKRSEVTDTVEKLNNNYYAQGQTAIDYFSAQYRVQYDYRDYKPYPTKGFLIDGVIIKDGFGLLKNETANNLSLYASGKVYFKLFSRTYMMNAVKWRYMPLYTPMYYFNRALGYGELVRGYEYYVVDGQNFVLFKSNLRFQVIKPRVIRMPVKGLKKFNNITYALYVGPFADAGYVQDNFFYQNNLLSNEWLLGSGIGIDLIAYYDLVFRVEFSVNRWQQPGIYLHLNAPL
jgi:outer membrane protein assembly factor BamA